ncbi:MAG: hypothetical protein VKK59_01025 [Vampirovibrionales bacterium]|nr:hypothetical protein [Vampirovibrionales bacterium]
MISSPYTRLAYGAPLYAPRYVAAQPATMTMPSMAMPVPRAFYPHAQVYPPVSPLASVAPWVSSYAAPPLYPPAMNRIVTPMTPQIVYVVPQPPSGLSMPANPMAEAIPMSLPGSSNPQPSMTSTPSAAMEAPVPEASRLEPAKAATITPSHRVMKTLKHDVEALERAAAKHVPHRASASDLPENANIIGRIASESENIQDAPEFESTNRKRSPLASFWRLVKAGIKGGVSGTVLGSALMMPLLLLKPVRQNKAPKIFWGLATAVMATLGAFSGTALALIGQSAREITGSATTSR